MEDRAVPAREHARRRLPACQERRLDVDSEHAIDVVVVDVEEVASLEDSGRVYERVDAAELLRHVQHTTEILDARDVAAHEAGDPSGCRDRFVGWGPAFAWLAPEVGHGDDRALACEAQRSRTADPACAAGDDGDTAREQRHQRLFSASRSRRDARPE